MILFGEPRWVPVVEHVARLRSCYLYTLTPRRWRWVAYVMAWIVVHIGGEEGAWILTPDQAREKLDNYRNWMGENRVNG